MSFANAASGKRAGPNAAKHESEVVMRTQLRGTIARTNLMSCVYLIKSLCPEVCNLTEFREWDRIYTLAPEMKSPRATVRLRQHQLLHGVTQSHHLGKDNWPAWSLIYMGLPDRRVAAPCERRPVTTTAVGKEADAFLLLLGCRFSYEYVRKGVRFRSRDGLTVDIYIAERLVKPGDPSLCEAIVPGDDQCCVVEVSADGTDIPPERLIEFMGFLTQYVTIDNQPARKPGK